jgi:hypothetical protein
MRRFFPLARRVKLERRGQMEPLEELVMMCHRESQLCCPLLLQLLVWRLSVTLQPSPGENCISAGISDHECFNCLMGIYIKFELLGDRS